MQSLHSRRGFLLIDALVGIAIFALFATAGFMTMMLGQEGSLAGGDRIRAVYLSNRALEVARTLREDDFDNLADDGIYGVELDPDGTWALAGTGSVTSDGFTTSLAIAAIDDDRVRLIARTSWRHGTVSSGSVLLEAELANWRGVDGGDWSNITAEGSYTDGGTPLFNHIAIEGDHAFVSSEVSGGGDGLYVVDVSDGSDPQRVSAAFELGAAGYGVIADGSTLYVVAGDDATELRSYDISSPESFDAGDLLDSLNLPGESLGRAIALNGDTLFVGALHSEDPGDDEFYAFDVSNPADITLLDSLNDTGGISAISVRRNYAYVAHGDDVSELRVVDARDPQNLALAPGEGYNLTDTPDGTAVVAYGTGILLGRASGDATDEFIRFAHQGDGVPSAPPGPWYREMGAAVRGLAVDVTECAGFAATESDAKELQIVNIADTALPERTYANVNTGAGRGLAYDAHLNRVFLTTNTALHIFAPGAGSMSCP